MSDHKQLRRAGVVVALLFLGFTAVDYTTAVWPLEPSEIRWRYGALSGLSGSLLTPSFGILILLAVAMSAGKRWLELTLAATLGIVSLGLAAATVMFGLDVLQLRGDVQPELLSEYDVTAIRSAVKLAAGSVATLVVGFFALSAWRATPKPARIRRTAEPTLIHLGTVGTVAEQEMSR